MKVESCLGAEAAEDGQEALHASLVIVAELDIVSKELNLAETRSSSHNSEATDQVLCRRKERDTRNMDD